MGITRKEGVKVEVKIVLPCRELLYYASNLEAASAYSHGFGKLAYRNGVYMIDEELDRCTIAWVDIFTGLAPLLHELVVELDQQERLVLYRSEQIVFPYEVEHVWTSEAQEVR